MENSCFGAEDFVRWCDQEMASLDDKKGSGEVAGESEKSNACEMP